MPSSSGRITKARKGKSAPTHGKNHRWESFNAKIAQIGALDPLHRVRRHDLDAEEISTTTSYFRRGLQRWSELNMARGFVAFKRGALPLCESLPQLLHFEARIMELLAEHIAAHEKESLEPLLELLTAFARDLGVRFEKHYGRALELISGILAKPQDVEVIEWAFGSLAWLFKYLWRLLVPNLCPTYDALAPLLGRTRHTPHVARFAAEALSFLIKKAASPSNRETALGRIVHHVRDDLYTMAEDRQFTLYRDGIMLMFAEAIKGTGEAIHTSGPALAQALLAALPEAEREPNPSPIWTGVICGSLTSVIHGSNASAMTELMAAIVEHIKSDVEGTPPADRSWGCLPWFRVLEVLAGVRGGSRVAEWFPLVDALVSLLESLAQARPNVPEDIDGLLWQGVIVNAAVVWQQAPVDALIKRKAAFTQAMTKEPCMQWFIPFCAYLDQLDSPRFNSLFRQDFQKFIVTHWSDRKNENMLCVLLPRMSQASSGDKLKLPQVWQDQIVAKFERLEGTPFPERGVYDKDPQTWRDVCLPKYSTLLRLLECTAVHPSTNARISDLLLKKLKLALRPSSTLASDEVHFIISQGFKSYLRMTRGAATVDGGLGPLLRAAVPRFGESVAFLQAFLEYEQLTVGPTKPGEGDKRSDNEDSAVDEDPLLFGPLVKNLASCSSELRLISLQLLQHLNTGPSATSSIETMLQIEHTHVAIAEVRAFGMHLRKLSIGYPHVDSQSWLARAIPTFVFGTLTIKLSPVWDDATEAMKLIAKAKSVGEESICELAFEWLNVPSPKWSGPAALPARWNALTQFDCTHLTKLNSIASDLFGLFGQPETTMLRAFDEQQRTAETHAHNARAQALKVFGSIPELAEKRSRRVVPLFLGWAEVETEAGAVDVSEEDDTARPSATTWSLSDRKAFLSVFGQFVNPRALYQHGRVYTTLLELLKNGDAGLQKSVLKAIFTWKQEGVRPYQETLESLLDESKFKNEVTRLLQDDVDGIKPEHRGELMPVLLRLLFGRSIAKKGAKSVATGNRLAVIRNLSNEDMGAFLEIAIGRLRDVRIFNMGSAQKKLFEQPIIPIRNQYGFLNMIASLVTELGRNTSLYVDRLLNSVLYCLMFAHKHIQASNEARADMHDDGDDPKPEGGGSVELLKSIRTTGLKCLNLLFQIASGYDWTQYRHGVMREVVCPRIEKLPIETAQGVSGLLQLFSTWSQSQNTVLFFCDDAEIQSILPKVIECLAVEKAKDEVKVFVLGIIRALVKVAVDPETSAQTAGRIKTELLEANSSDILQHMITILRSSGLGISLLEASIETIVDLAPLLEQSNQTASVLDISTFLLEQPPRRVSPKAKGRILLVVELFVALFAQAPDTPAKAKTAEKLYGTLSSLFSYFKDRENREALARIFLVFAQTKPELQEVATLVTDLNSFSKRRIDEPDYDRRLAAYASVARERESPLGRNRWLPLLHNFLFFIRTIEEFDVLSSNSADGLRRFIQDAATCADDVEKSCFREDLRTILLPALYAGAKEESDKVRRNFLRVFGGLLMQMPEWEPIASLRGLLDEVDEETAEPAFFFHLLSPAASRRLEALELLEKANGRIEIGSTILNSCFIPLLEHLVFDQPGGNDGHGIGARAVDVVGSLAQSLEWKHYRTTLQRFISYIESRPESLKRVVRLLGKTVDALVLAVESKASQTQDPDAMVDELNSVRTLARTLPRDEKFQTDILDYFVPSLAKHVHEKDESEVSHRVPVGVIVVKMLKMLPEEQMNVKLGGVLTDICHILRSKAWESREMARDTLVKISVILGPSFFGFILKELRGALQKGYQLHILSYTLHSILVSIIPKFEQGDLDEWLPVMVTIIMDDIFGVTGQEKEAEGYTTDMKEIKSSKSQDSMELIARNSSIERLNALVSPLKDLLMEKIDLKLVRKIDTLLTRIATGLLQNPAANSRATLVLCYEVIQEFYNSQKTGVGAKLDPKLRKYLYRRGASDIQKGMNVKHTYKLVRFALEILRSTLKKNDHLRTPANIAGFVPILGDLVIAGEDEVKTAVFKLLPVIAKVPFKDDESVKLFKVATKEAIASVSRAATSTTDLAQAALKFLSVVLRDRRDVPVKDAAIDMLLGKVKDDLTQPLHRHVTFSFLRSVLDRKIETASVYDTVDYVGTVMITNDDKGTRDLARGAFFQFLREYPQKMARWSKQLNFIVANLKYEREGGRESVMEVVHLLLNKSSDDFVQEVAATCFLPLIFVLANDDSEKCRRLAALLVRDIFAKADTQRMSKFLSLIQSWVGNDENAAVMRLGVEAFALYFGAREGAAKDKASFQLALDRASSVIQADDVAGSDVDLVNAALDVVGVLATKVPARLLSPDCEQVWVGVGNCSKHPDHTVKLSSINLVARYLVSFRESGLQTPKGSLKGPHGIELDEPKIKSFVRFGLGVLNGIDVNADVAKHAEEILNFLAPKLADGAPQEQDVESDAEEQDDGDEEEEARATTLEKQGNDLQYLFWRLSAILRKEVPIRGAALVGKLSAMEVFEQLCRTLPTERLSASLRTILTPLHQLADPTIRPPHSTDDVFRTGYERLKTRAQVLMDALHRKFGTAEYTRELLAVRERVKARREQRSSKRKIEAVTQPERYGKYKQKKVERKKARHGVRVKDEKARRHAFKSW